MRTLIYTRLQFRVWFILFASLVATITQSGIVYAAGFQEPPTITNREKAHLNITFTGGGNTSCSDTAVDATFISGGRNPKIAFDFFVSKGFSEKQAAGIVGNFMWESGVDPMKVQGGERSKTLPASGGYGLAQWDDRKIKLKGYSERPNEKRPIHDLSLQLDFVIFELKGDEKAAYDLFKQTSTIRDATTVWETKYERPQPGSTEERIKAANKIYGEYGTGSSKPGNGDPLANIPEVPAVSEDEGCDSSSGGGGSIVAIAQQELKKKVLEDPIGCDAGNPSTPGDCGKEVNKYTDNTLEYWCADFVSWVYRQAGKPFKGGSSGGWRLPAAETVQAYMQKNGQFYPNRPSSPDPKPGDIYIINNGQHVGIVVKVEGNKMYTISGNTSTESFSNGVGVGDAVYSNFKKDATITGYGGLR